MAGDVLVAVVEFQHCGTFGDGLKRRSKGPVGFCFATNRSSALVARSALRVPLWLRTVVT